MTDNDSTTTTALALRPNVLPSVAQFQMMRDLAERLAYAEGFLPKHFFMGDPRTRPHRVLAAIEYGRAVGIEPMIALQNITMIDGKVGASALLVGALLRRGGYEIETAYELAPELTCTVTLTKQGKVTGQGVFSMADAKHAGLLREGSGWTKYPRDMLYARALTQAARQGAQDAMLGMAYTAEELGAEVDEDGQVTGEIPTAQASPETAAAFVEAQGSDQRQDGADSPPAIAVQGPAAAVTPAPPQTPPTRSGGARAKRTNVVTAPQVATAPVAVAEAPPAPTAADDLLDGQEPLSPPVDDGLNPQREILRQSAGELVHVRALLENVKAALEGKEPRPVPPRTPSTESDAALARRIEADWPGRTLATIGASQLQGLLERFESTLAKFKAQMAERGIKDE